MGPQGLRFAAGNFYINDKPTGAVVGQQPFGGAPGLGHQRQGRRPAEPGALDRRRARSRRPSSRRRTTATRTWAEKGAVPVSTTPARSSGSSTGPSPGWSPGALPGSGVTGRGRRSRAAGSRWGSWLALLPARGSPRTDEHVPVGFLHLGAAPSYVGARGRSGRGATSLRWLGSQAPRGRGGGAGTPRPRGARRRRARSAAGARRCRYAGDCGRFCGVLTRVAAGS